VTYSLHPEAEKELVEAFAFWWWAISSASLATGVPE